MRVGTSAVHCKGRACNEDHPHACGDKASKLCVKQCLRGSSPCVWGQDQSKQGLFDEYRIIPMRVGTSADSSSTQNADEDHPHACGDKLSPAEYGCSKIGSSPCVWGQVPAQIYS